MATWEDMLNTSYNPVYAERERHKRLVEQRKAENLAKMQAANPGFLPGGMGQTNQPQFQQFTQPSVMANKDDWLASQHEMASEHFGGAADPAGPDTSTAPGAPSVSSGGNFAPAYTGGGGIGVDPE